MDVFEHLRADDHVEARVRKRQVEGAAADEGQTSVGGRRGRELLAATRGCAEVLLRQIEADGVHGMFEPRRQRMPTFTAADVEDALAGLQAQAREIDGREAHAWGAS